jgi:hypothetical protein
VGGVKKMKLVNPAGRDISTFNTEANRCACMCSTSSLWNSAYQSADDYTCSCECSYGDANSNANYNSSYEA